MRLTFLGAAREVGRSCFYLETSDTTAFLDCGNKMQEDRGPAQPPEVQHVPRPQAVILSHAHLDHSGYIPALFPHYAPIVYATTPTFSVCNMLYLDALKIAKNEKFPSPFSQSDLQKAMRNFSTLGYGMQFKLAASTTFEFIDAGHILGAAQVLVKNKGKSLLYTGDFKYGETRMHAGAVLPGEPIDTLVIEATYGLHDQPDRKQLEDAFCEDVTKVVNEGGVAVIPAFALGRTQEIMTLLSQNRVPGDVYVQGMGARINEIYSLYQSYIKNPAAFDVALDKVQWIQSKEMRKKALGGGSIIICTAGMLDAGPIMDYIPAVERANLPSKIFLTGYQAPGTNGARLLEKGEVYLRKQHQTLQVTTPYEFYPFSAHSSKDELIEYVKKVNPSKVITVHGEEEGCDAFLATLKENGFDAQSPALLDKVEL